MQRRDNQDKNKAIRIRELNEKNTKGRNFFRKETLYKCAQSVKHVSYKLYQL